MTETFLAAVYRELEVKIEEVNNLLLSGTVSSMEHYKQLYGRKEGLEVAYNAIKLVYKKLISNDEERHDGNSESKSTRSIY